MKMQPPEQGLEGSFYTYGPPETLADCKSLVTQAAKDSCRHLNERVIEEPMHGGVVVRNLTTSEKHAQELDPQGHFRMALTPDQYEVCVNEECSDPLEVTRGVFLPYGQRVPRTPADKAQAKKQP